MSPALDPRHIHKTFGSVHALQGADFSLRKGELHALLGENGAGKSTLMQPSLEFAAKLLLLAVWVGRSSGRSSRGIAADNLEVLRMAVPLKHVAPGRFDARSYSLLERFGVLQ
jgi:ABC-type cobalamin/Fe3+-siderophores transport system ATPase subunit